MALDLGLTSALARYVAQGRATTALVVRIAALRLLIIGAAAAVILGASIGDAAGGSRVAELLPALAALVIAQSLVSFFFGSLPSMRRIRLLLLVTVAQPLVELVFVLRVRAGGGGAEEMVLATTYAGLAVSAVAWVVLVVRGRAMSAEV